MGCGVMVLAQLAAAAVGRSGRRLSSRAAALVDSGVALPPRWRRALFVAFVGGLLAYGGWNAWRLLFPPDLISLLERNNDDAYYYFQTAWHLAQGHFSTFDGGITRTNGYHPLWLLLITPFYWFFDKETALFGIKAFELLLVAGGVALVAAAAYLARLPWLLLGAALPPLYTGWRMVRGMEAAAALLMLGLLFLALMLYAGRPSRWKWLLAAVCFALPWARLEYIAISLAVAGALCLIEFPRRDRTPGASWLARLRAYAPLTPLLGAVAGILVYFAYNGLVFGGIVPVSGATKAAWSQYYWAQDGGYSFTQNLAWAVRQVAVFDWELLAALEVCGWLLVVWWCVRRWDEPGGRRLLAFLLGAFGLAAGHLAMFGYNVLAVHPKLLGVFDWYFVPAYLLMALLVPLRCYAVLYCLRRFVGPRWPRAAGLLSWGAVAAAAAYLLVSVNFANPFGVFDGNNDRATRDPVLANYYMGTQTLNRILPAGSIVGSWDAGVIAYFSRFPVVNLDGLMNDYDYLRQRRGQMTVSYVDFLDFYQRFGTDYYTNPTSIQWDKYLYRPTNNLRAIYRGPWFNSGPHEPLPWRVSVWTAGATDGPEGAGLWERLAPQFARRSNGLGLLLDGRAAQAFAPGCADDELIVWTYAGVGDDSATATYLRPGLGTQRMDGLCTDSLILPRNAAATVSVELLRAGEYLARLEQNGPPLISDSFDVYLIDHTLVYVNGDCGESDDAAPFFLHLTPAHRRDRTWGSEWGFQQYDFRFSLYGWRSGGLCLAARDLPDYDLAYIATGQFTAEEGELWKGAAQLDSRPLQAAYAAATAAESGPPAISAAFSPAAFDVYHRDGGLTYIKEPCAPEDTAARFRLHPIAADADDLPEGRREAGFDHRDFAFNAYGMRFAGRCVAVAPLPDYPLAALRTGQFDAASGEKFWEYYLITDTAGLERAYAVAQYRAPTAVADFAVYYREGGLTYIKEPCAPADHSAVFFLHATPLDAADLPEHRRADGFDNLDFRFEEHGARYAGKCVADVPLPSYPIAALRTGQYSAAENRNLWAAEFAVGD